MARLAPALLLALLRLAVPAEAEGPAAPPAPPAGVAAAGPEPDAPAAGGPAGGAGNGNGAASTILDLRPEVVFREFMYEGPFRRLSGVYCDPVSGEITVADPGQDTIGIFDENGVPLFAFSDEEHLDAPTRVAVDREGRIHVIDADRGAVKVFSYRGEYLERIDVAAAAKQKAVGLTALAFDEEGNLYLGDSTNGQVLVLDHRRQVKVRFGGPGTGKGEFTTISGIAVDGERIYVSDNLAFGVQVFSRHGRFLAGWGIHEVGRANVSFPSGIAVDAKGRIVLVDQMRHDLKYFAPDGRLIEQFGGMGTGPGEVASPADVSIGRGGRICVAERGNHRVQVLAPVEGVPPKETDVRKLRGIPTRAAR